MQMTLPQPSAPKITSKSDSELGRGWKQLDASTDMAEIALVAGNFTAAATQAEDMLRRTLYIPDSTSIQLRATFVVLQALYELDRCSSLHLVVQF